MLSAAMPELPEVETVARSLRPRLVGREVRAVETSGLALRRPIDKKALRKALVGARVDSVERRGKYILVAATSRTAGAQLVVAHLGMTGRFLFCDADAPLAPHTHARFLLDENGPRELRYVDPRRFGQIAVYPAATAARSDELSVLGVDPLEPAFTVEWLRAELDTSRRDLKSFLLDQGRIAGLGNIYVCEALHRARLHPERRADEVTADAARRLHAAIREVLETSIKNRGTTFSDYVDADGEFGSNQSALGVYGREGERCRALKCRGTIVRIVQAGRSTFFCPVHQR
jgi:formamidopyrimidine-DNA glycosylase